MDRSLVGYSPWGHKESDTTEVTEHARTSPLSLCPRKSRLRDAAGVTVQKIS